MGIFFGTDGIRGKALEELSFDVAYKCGNALAQIKNNATILMGQDTRVSGNYILNSFAVGAMGAGAKIIDIGICTTPCVAYLTKLLKCDYGVMISASHNSAEYNGIKIFGGDGYKLGDLKEEQIERKFICQKITSFNNLGTYEQHLDYKNLYINHIKKISKVSLNNLKIVLDCSNGGAYKIATKIFKELGANVIEVACKNDGMNINNNCGSLYPQKMIDAVLKEKANIGFGFDGDADRIIACDENGTLLDGDNLLHILAIYLKNKNRLNENVVVGTRHTNMGIENEFKNNGITLLRADIGDKYVIEKMLKEKANLGGEKSGHIIFSDYATTGDGVLSAIIISNIVNELNKPLSSLICKNLYPQENIDVIVSDKIKVINSQTLQEEIITQEKLLGENSRIMVRVSGTEPKIRIMVETKIVQIAKEVAKKLEDIIKKIDSNS